MKKLLIIVLLATISGCSSFRYQGNNKLNLPDEIFYSCKDLPKLESSEDVDILKNSKETFQLYQECKRWNEEKNKILKKLR